MPCKLSVTKYRPGMSETRCVKYDVLCDGGGSDKKDCPLWNRGQS